MAAPQTRHVVMPNAVRDVLFFFASMVKCITELLFLRDAQHSVPAHFICAVEDISATMVFHL
jgi:hypothetical protein